MKTKVSIKEIKDEITQIRKKYPKVKDDSAFVLWFLRAFLADSEDMALKALTGDVCDKGIDAILIDERAKQVHLVQGKFHHSLGDFSEKRSDILTFADLGILPWESKETLTAFYSKLDPLVCQKFKELVHSVQRNKYELRLYYVTTGRCSETIRNEARERVRQAEGPVEISIFDYAQIVTIFKDYLEGVAPAVPTLLLRVASEGTIRTEGVIHCFDSEKQIESWVFSMSTKDVGEMFKKAGIRLFARNIRGYLGQSNEINEGMAKTIRNEPHNFWYYNNGVTIVCDDAKREIQGGEDFLRVERPQVINGQQTTRTLYENPSDKASLLVRVIKIPRNPRDEDEYDDLVSSIVRATNWQNAIKPSDLVSNDYIQVFLEREMRKRGYQYIRKRMTKSEAKTLFGAQGYYQIKKDEMAQAVAACEFDPALVRKGKEGIFNERYYRSIFGSRSISFYLSRWWLMRQVQSAAYGYPERAYAKWLVLHFVWDRLSQDIGSGQTEQRFRYACEQSMDDVLRHLRNALDGMFRAALAFYRTKRGKGEEAKDVSTFFQLTKLNLQFTKFWHSAKNRHRKTVEDKIRKFRVALKNIEIPT
jgi:hypothetical protein